MPTYTNGTTATITEVKGDKCYSAEPGLSITAYHILTNSGWTKTSDAPYFNPNSTAPITASLTEAAATKTITGISKAAAAVITATAHGYSTNDYVYIDAAAVGMERPSVENVRLKDSIQKITVIDVNTFSIPVNTTAFSTYTSGGTVRKVVPVAVGISSKTNAIQIAKVSYGATVRVHYQSTDNKPHVSDVTSDYDDKRTGLQGRMDTLYLTEIAGGTTPTCAVIQEV